MSEKTIFFDRVHIILTNRANRGAAFEQALKPDSNYDDAGWSLGLLYLYSKDKTCADSKKAFDIFSRFYNKDKTNKWHVWLYGFSGYSVAYDQIKRNYALCKKAFNVRPGAIDYTHQLKRRKEYDNRVQQKNIISNLSKRPQ